MGFNGAWDLWNGIWEKGPPRVLGGRGEAEEGQAGGLARARGAGCQRLGDAGMWVAVRRGLGARVHLLIVLHEAGGVIARARAQRRASRVMGSFSI